MAERTNFLKESRKVLLFFCFSFVLFFLAINLIHFFNFLGKQAAALVETEKQFSLKVLPEAANPALPPQENFILTEKENSLEIPKISIKTPLIIAKSEEMKEIIQDLKKGVVVYPGSDLPGQGGRLTIIGHSAPLSWPKIRYDWIFSKLGELEADDEILINFEHRQYRYKAVEKIFLEKGEQVPDSEGESSGQVVYLITCWPPGRDLKRLVIKAELVN
ncbi:MAG: sortase [bacterium]|nr:sortase [bacterium]